jgi:hypothetical protein
VLGHFSDTSALPAAIFLVSLIINSYLNGTLDV